MKLSSMPSLVAVPFADQGTKNAIPVESQIGITDGAASFTDGFPPLTMTPVVAGGIPPAGGDFNGILNAITQSVRWTCAGGQYKYDGAFSTTVGGYPKGAMIQNPAGDVIWLNTVDDNNTNPDNGTGWIPAIRYGLTNIALAGSNVTLTPSQAAKETITLTGTLTANVQVIMPAWVETWLIINNTTGGFVVSVKTASGSGVNLAAATSSQIYGDGTNIYYGALMVRNNLAEIKAAGTNSQTAARGNIGCGTASTHDVTTSTSDTTPGRVLKVRDFGLGSTNSNDLLGSIFDITCERTYSALGAGAEPPTEGMPDNSGNTRFTACAFNVYTNIYWVFLISNKQSYAGMLDISKQTISWSQFYSTDFKPTAADTNSIYQSPSALSVDLNTLGGTKSGRYYQTTIANATAAFHYPVSSAGTLDVYKNGANGSEGCVQEYRTHASNQLFRRQYNVNSSSVWVWSEWIEEYNTANPPPSVDLSPYMKTVDANAKFVKGIQLGAQGSYTPTSNEVSWTFDCPAGCMLTGIVVQETGNGSADNIGGVHYQPIQKDINGTWTTIPG